MSTESRTAPGRPPLLNPRSVPVAGSDDHLPPLPPQLLTPRALRQRLLETQGQAAQIQGDGARSGLFPAGPSSAAAVLVPLIDGASGLQVLLTRRTDHLRNHAGQISFPGGRVEADDLDAVATALREAREEVGLLPGSIEVLGLMPTYTTVTRFVVTPVVALVAPDHRLQLDANEVAETFEVPLAFLMNPAHHQRHVFEVDGARHQFLSMPWRNSGAEYFIWGATAAMLRNLYHLLAH